jgi:hypothetical protein
MKPAGFLLFIPAGLAAVLAADEAQTGLTSRATKARITEGLPVWHTPVTKPDGTPGTEGTPPADVLILPKMTVKEKRLPPDADDKLMSKRDFSRKMINLDYDDLYKDSRLEAFLNDMSIPLLSPSRADRGRALALGKELDRLADLLSPEEAKGLQGMFDGLAHVVGQRAPKRR